MIALGRTLKRRAAPPRLARLVARRIGWLPVPEPGPPPPCPPGSRTGPPDFVGIGVQRAGTTWWYTLINAHPDVARGANKELHFFANFWRDSFQHPHVARYHAYFPKKEGQIVGEWTPRYMLDFWTPRLLKRAAPETKLLALLRDPVLRYVSGLTVGLQGGVPPFHPAVAQDAAARGFYFDQLSRVRESFDRERILILQYEACQRNPLRELERTYRFLGIDSEFVPGDVRRPVDPTIDKEIIPDDVREALVGLYRRDVLQLAEAFSEIDLSLWPHFADLAR